MKTFLKYYFFYLIVLLFVFYKIISKAYVYVLIFPSIISIFSHFIAFIIYYLKDKKEDKNRIFNNTFLFIFILFTVGILYFSFSKWYTKKYYGNINSNIRFSKEFLNSDMERLAVDSLNKLIINKNSFKLNAFYLDSYDTLINNDKKIYNFIQLEYFNEETQNINKAKFVYINDKPINIYYNKNLDYNDINRTDSLLKIGSSYLKEIKKNLPDNLSENIPENISKEY